MIKIEPYQLDRKIENTYQLNGKKALEYKTIQASDCDMKFDVSLSKSLLAYF